MGTSLDDMRMQVCRFWNTASDSDLEMVLHSLEVEDKKVAQFSPEWPAIDSFAGKYVATQIH